MPIEKKLKYQGSSVFYRVYGNGKPVMLVHGFGETGDIWKNQVEGGPGPLHPDSYRDSPQGGGGPLPTSPQGEGLEESLQKEKIKPIESSQVPPQGRFRGALPKDKFMFIVPDLPGSGQSEMIDDMSMEGMAEVIKVILEDLPPTPSKGGGGSPLHPDSYRDSPQGGGSPLQTSPQGGGLQQSLQEENTKVSESSQVPPPGGLRGASLIGHSMGGYIALAFAEKYPDHLNAFGLFHSTAFADSEEKKAVRRKGIEFIREHGSYEFLKTAIPNLFSADTKSRADARSNIIDDLVAEGSKFQPEALISYYEAMIQRPDRTAVLKNSRVPVLFIIGEQDNTIPMQDMLKQSHMPERSFIHILHHSGHMGMLEEINTNNDSLKDFLLQV